MKIHMKPVQRKEIVDYVTYGEQRDAIRMSVMKIKEQRRIHVGLYLTFLFENTETIRYQIQEMIRAERIVKEANILHEIKTYNELLGSPGELGSTLLIEIDNPAERDLRLRQWVNLPKYVHAILQDGTRIPATFDPRQIGEEKLSSVQYIKFNTEGQVPVSLRCEHKHLSAKFDLTPEQQAALAADLCSHTG